MVTVEILLVSPDLVLGGDCVVPLEAGAGDGLGAAVALLPRLPAAVGLNLLTQREMETHNV